MMRVVFDSLLKMRFYRDSAEAKAVLSRSASPPPHLSPHLHSLWARAGAGEAFPGTGRAPAGHAAVTQQRFQTPQWLYL